MFLGLGSHNLSFLCAERTNILAYFSPIIKDSRVLTVIWDRAEPHQPHRHGARLHRRHLFPGLPRGPPDQVPARARTAGLVPDQVVLHLQHPHHLTGVLALLG